MSNNSKELSKFLSYILRHEPESIKLSLDTEGWANISELIELANLSGQSITREQVLEVVATSDKKRFSLSSDQTQIRAAQGHSLKTVAINFKEQQPPAMLLHGTASKNIDAIRRKGLIAGERQYVHLTENSDTATATGTRYGKPVLLTIDSLTMYQDGFKFYLSDNNVWLTEQVLPEYIEF